MDKKTTQLHKYHLSQEAKFIDFGDWSMPFSYEGTLKEHDIVRTSSGFFDVSHMGRLEIQYSEIEKISKLICSEIIDIPTLTRHFILSLQTQMAMLLMMLFFGNLMIRSY